MHAIYLFTKDLRIIDNPSLERCCAENQHVYPIFLLNTKQLINNPYYSARSVKFMLEALGALNAALGDKLTIVMGTNDVVLECRDNIARQVGAPVKIYISHDYTEFSKQRAEHMSAIVTRDMLCTVDHPYMVFAPYQRRVKMIGVARPVDKHGEILSKITKCTVCKSLDVATLIDGMKNISSVAYRANKPVELHGNKIPAVTFTKYSNRNYPAMGVTTLLSPYIRFGVLSLRQAYYLSTNDDFRREIIYRQYFYQLYEAHRERVETEFYTTKYTDGRHLQNYKMHEDDGFMKWCRGDTGVSIVDAGMRELLHTGYMHNRCRMICASYLIHTLGYHWSLGEKYFATQLRDYDHVINKMNWVWVAGLPIFNRRPPLAFNPALQTKKYDHDAEYCKFWNEFK